MKICPVTIVDQDKMQRLGEENSIEDLQDRWNLVRRCTDCGIRIEKTLLLLSICIACGEEWVQEDYEIALVGNDVVSCFPNILSKSTVKMVRGEVEKSTLVIKSFN